MKIVAEVHAAKTETETFLSTWAGRLWFVLVHVPKLAYRIVTGRIEIVDTELPPRSIAIGTDVMRGLMLLGCLSWGSPEQQLDDAIRIHLKDAIRKLSKNPYYAPTASDIERLLSKPTVLPRSQGGHGE